MAGDEKPPISKPVFDLAKEALEVARRNAEDDSAVSNIVPDLDVPGTGRVHRSVPKMAAVKAPVSSPVLAAATPEAPSLDPRPVSAPPASVPRAAVASAPPASSPSLRAASAAASAPPGSSPELRAPTVRAPAAVKGPSIAFDVADDDDFDMQIEHNLSSSAMPSAMSGRPSGIQGSGRPSGIASTGLELTSRPTNRTRPQAEEDDGEISRGARLAGLAFAGVVLGGSAFALVRFAHRAGGLSLTAGLPHAFDGSAASESGAISLAALATAIGLGFAGLKVNPRSWSMVASGGAMLFLALAMVTVTLGSTGENATPPDGVLLVPFLAPASILLLGLGIGGRAAHLFAQGGIARRAGALPVAAIGGAIAFLAYEVSRLAQ